MNNYFISKRSLMSSTCDLPSIMLHAGTLWRARQPWSFSPGTCIFPVGRGGRGRTQQAVSRFFPSVLQMGHLNAPSFVHACMRSRVSSTNAWTLSLHQSVLVDCSCGTATTVLEMKAFFPVHFHKRRDQVTCPKLHRWSDSEPKF